MAHDEEIANRLEQNLGLQACAESVDNGKPIRENAQRRHPADHRPLPLLRRLRAGYKESGIGRETRKMMLDHYQQTKTLLVSYNPNKLGFF